MLPISPVSQARLQMHTIRRATLADAAVILGVQKRAFAEEGRRCEDREIPPLTETLEAVAAHIETQAVLVACHGTEIVGSVRGIRSGPVCTIRALSIAPEHQGRGIGSSLLRAIELAHPMATLFDLLTNTAMPGNVRFYERHGYEVRELRRHSEKIELAYLTKASAASGV
jgi:ribosomal protein S18 acetylase RimI-like enzyme